MKPLLTLAALFLSCIGIAQIPGLRADLFVNPGVTGRSFIYDSRTLPGNGFLIAGVDTVFSTINEGEAASKYAVGRPFISKLDSAGNTVWLRRPSNVDVHVSAFTAVEISNDGSCIAAGFGSRPSTYDSGNLYVARYTNNGNLVWDLSYGGSNVDRAYDIIQASDGNYLVAGFTQSVNGDVTGNHSKGYSDAWVIKLNAAGTILWKKCYGGSLADTAYAISETPDGGFLVAGVSTSADGDLTGNNGSSDAWVFKIDASGNLLWQKNIGGVAAEAFKSIAVNSDNTATLAGFTHSSTVATNGNKGLKDAWVLTLSLSDGAVLWSKTFGGSAHEEALSIGRKGGNEFLVTGFSSSQNGDLASNSGGTDIWTFLLDPAGELIWEKSIGSATNDYGYTSHALSATDYAVMGSRFWPTRSTDQNYIAWLGNSNVLQGYMFLDLNSNGIKDAGEKGFDESFVKVDKSGFSKSIKPFNGFFSLDLDSGNYAVTPVIHTPHFTVTPASRTVDFPAYFDTVSYPNAFAVQKLADVNDLQVTIIPLTAARPGFNASYKIFYKNTGSLTIPAGTLRFVKDSRVGFLFAVPAQSSRTGDIITWNYSNLAPFDSAAVTVTLRIQAPPTTNVDDILTFTADISPAAGDATPDDNAYSLRQLVTGSFDPNDKSENYLGTIEKQQVEDGNYITYLVRFQNMGTDTAFNIFIRDTLHHTVDRSSFQMINASHPCQVTITGDYIQWDFKNIRLVDKTRNEPASHGFVVYRIKPLSSLAAGTVIENAASIYFDFNLPVKTNTTLTQVRPHTTLPVTLVNFNGVYRDGQATLRWITENEFGMRRFELQRSVDGVAFELVAVKDPAGMGAGRNDYLQIDPLAGYRAVVVYYRLKMVDRDGSFSYSNVVALRRDRVGGSLSVSPNPVSAGEAWLKIESPAPAAVQISIINSAGRPVIVQKARLLEGQNNLRLEGLERLESGSYLIRVDREGKTETLKFVIFR